jgi:hypothetical protein
MEKRIECSILTATHFYSPHSFAVRRGVALSGFALTSLNRNLTETSLHFGFPNFAHEETLPGVLRLGSVSALFAKLR